MAAPAEDALRQEEHGVPPYGVETEAAATDVKDWDEHATGAKREFPDGFLWFPLSVEPLWNDDVPWPA